MAVRNYSNLATPRALTATISDVGVTATVASTTNYPDPPFLVAFERGTAQEEVALCTAKTATTFTVTRGFDDTDSFEHVAGTFIEHTSAAIDHREANAHVNTPHLDPEIAEQAGDLLVAISAGTYDRLAAGATAGHALLADPTETLKMEWADIGMGAWTTYTPSWHATTGAAPVLGNGSLTGRYKLVGKTLDLYFSLIFGSTTNGGTGIWFFGPPAGATVRNTPLQWGGAFINKLDVGVSGSCLADTNAITILCPDNSPASIAETFIKSSWPSSWINGDGLRVWGRFEVN